MLATRTMFNTPIVNVMLRLLSLACFKLMRWDMEGEFPEHHRCVMIAAPHTSNWDGVIMCGFAFVFRIRIFWLAKASLFRAPFGTIMRWFGGIAVDRNRAHDLVAQAVEVFNGNDKVILTVPPEGTRSRVAKWKSGFYHIAHGAQVPIVLGFLDYKRRRGGVLGEFLPTGDFEQDLQQIQACYKGIEGKHPQSTEL